MNRVVESTCDKREGLQKPGHTLEALHIVTITAHIIHLKKKLDVSIKIDLKGLGSFVASVISRMSTIADLLGIVLLLSQGIGIVRSKLEEQEV